MDEEEKRVPKVTYLQKLQTNWAYTLAMPDATYFEMIGCRINRLR